MGVLIVPHLRHKWELSSKIRDYFNERFQEDRDVKIQDIFLLKKDRCYVHLGIIKEDFQKGQSRFRTEEMDLAFDVVEGTGSMVMEA